MELNIPAGSIARFRGLGRLDAQIELAQHHRLDGALRNAAPDGSVYLARVSPVRVFQRGRSATRCLSRSAS